MGHCYWDTACDFWLWKLWKKLMTASVLSYRWPWCWWRPWHWLITVAATAYSALQFGGLVAILVVAWHSGSEPKKWVVVQQINSCDFFGDQISLQSRISMILRYEYPSKASLLALEWQPLAIANSWSMSVCQTHSHLPRQFFFCIVLFRNGSVKEFGYLIIY